MFKHLSTIALMASVLLIFSCNQKNKTMNDDILQPPLADKVDHEMTIHGDMRNDPYYWMRLSDEQKNAATPDEQTQKVLDYLNAENKYTDTILKKTEKLQASLFDEITGRIKKDDASVPYLRNGYWYYSKYEKGNEYPVYYRKKGSLEAAEETILDVNKLAKGFEYYAVGGMTISPDNKLLAFGEDTISRRQYTLRFLNMETGEFLNDKIDNTSGGGAWAKDNKTFFYATKDKVSLLETKIWRHELGAELSNDIMVYEEKDPSFYMGVSKSKSGDYIVIWSSSTLSSDYQILKADNPKDEFQSFAKRQPNMIYEIEHFDNKFYIKTNWDAVNFRIMETTVDKTERENWKEMIPHRENVLIESMDIFKDFFVLGERTNALPQIRVINQKTKEEHYLSFDEAAFVAYTSTNLEFDSKNLRFVYSSMTTPTSTFDYDMESKDKVLKKQQEVVGGHHPEEYVTERLFAEARDGKKVPISLVYKKGYKKDGNNPLLLYAYGSYGVITETWFSSTRLSLLDRGFCFAIAHIRGGESLGRQWYEDGKLLNKINSFNDFIDCSEYLINEKYTSSEHLYAMGGSAGGLLMGAIVNMAAEKYNGVIAAVPFVDVVTTMLDETIPLTTNEFDEWGNPKNKESYDYMLSYSPYDQVKEQAYPNMLITTGFFDSQVQYWEPAKWIAKLRDKKTDDNLLMMHTNMGAGHGGASGRFKRYKETALEYAFFLMLEGIEK